MFLRTLIPLFSLASVAAQNRCSLLGPNECFQNSEGKIGTAKGESTDDCCAACYAKPKCQAWTFEKGGSCNLYKNIGPHRKCSTVGSQGGISYAPGQPTPPPTPPPPPSPKPAPTPGPTPKYRNTTGLPNIVFLVVESTDGRTWSRGYSNDAIPLPNFRELQEGGLEFRRHYSNAPVCCPSRATFWSGRHAHNIPHDHNGVTVNGAWNNYEGLPLNYSDRIDQVLQRAGGYNVLVSGKTDWSVGGHSETVRLNAWTMYTRFPYDVNATGGWGDEGGTCASGGQVKTGGGVGSGKGSAHEGDWTTADKTCAWLEKSGNKDGNPFFVYQGMNIVHPPYVTNQYWYDRVNGSAIEVPEWVPLEELHPCEFQSSMLKGCTPSDADAAAFYNVSRRRQIRRIYAAMVAEFDAMVGQYMATVKRMPGAWENTVWIVTSDHGDMQLERQQHYKMVPYDASASVPMVMYDGRPGKQLAGGGKVVTEVTQLIDVFPTVMELANVSTEFYDQAALNGHSLMPLFDAEADNTDDAGIAGAGAVTTKRPDFVVSQFHGDNIAMSWFLVVQNFPADAASSSGRFSLKLIVWGTGNEVPSQLFNLTADPGERRDLIADPAYATYLQTLNASLLSVVDYPAVAQNVAQYGKDMFGEWVNSTGGPGGNWSEAMHKKGIRWDASWEADPAGSVAAVKAWMAEPAEVLACRGALKWPEKDE